VWYKEYLETKIGEKQGIHFGSWKHAFTQKKTYFKISIYFENKLAHNSPHSICALKVLRKKRYFLCHE
jgi:hypothetical protein